ncbi:hypothetical protein ACRQ5B_08995 [Pseudarthrobacter sp. L19]|uniref:hypothetical protein n=1 Tax=Pseudarthrobacter sp. L19 TaxID=3423951 RepID=UPI003D795974
MGIRANINAGREFLLSNSVFPAPHFREFRIHRRYNLGNHLRQVVNAVRFAELHQVPSVRLPADSFFMPGQVGDVRLLEHGTADQVRPILVGDFFYYEKLGVDIQNLQRARVLRNLRPLAIDLQATEPVEKLGIHLRAGDAFEPNPHPSYMPPPLSFFLESIQKSNRRIGGGVHLVCQELSHPYVEPIKAFCKLEGIRLEISSSSLSEDFRLLASFRELCLSQGTLGLAAAWLSAHCQRVFAFERESNEISTTLELGLQVDEAASAVPFGAWQALPEQIARLTDISASPLIWRR